MSEFNLFFGGFFLAWAINYAFDKRWAWAVWTGFVACINLATWALR